MTPLLTCKRFLQELNDYLDETLDPEIRSDLQRHVNECPNCWVFCNTTEKTLRIFKGMDAKPMPAHVEERIMAALQKRMAEKGPICDKKAEV